MDTIKRQYICNRASIIFEFGGGGLTLYTLNRK